MEMDADDVLIYYLSCKYKGYLALQGEKGELSEYGRLQNRLRLDYKSAATSAIINYDPQSFVLRNSPVTITDLKRGATFIVDVAIDHKSIVCGLDALKRVDGKSPLGPFHYAPIVFSENDASGKSINRLLALQSLLLSRIQKVQPDFGMVVYGPEHKLRTVHLRKYYSEAQQIIDDILDVFNEITVPKLVLNKHCHICPYEKRCLNQAKKEDNLSLIGIGEKDIGRFNRKGIFTVNQLSYTFRPRRRNKRVKAQTPVYYHALRALAVRENKVYVALKPDMPRTKTRVFVDMEGNAGGTSIYLIGALVVKDDRQTSFAFWADTCNAEKEIFTKFCDLLSGLDGVHLFYYGSYESRVFRRLFPLVSAIKVKDIFLNQSTNMVSMIYARIYFPTHSNQLKDVGRYLGCTWSTPNSSGLQSIVWRTQWEVSHDEGLKNTLIRYNQEDCGALKTITEFVDGLSFSDCSDADSVLPPDTVPVDKIERDEEWNREWGHKTSALDEYDDIVKCAYFDYQRNKVFVRTDERLKAIVNRERRCKRKPSYRINEKIDYKLLKCPYCKSRNISRDRNDYHARDSFDLRFFSGGIKRWVTRYRAPIHTCLNCGMKPVPLKFRTQKAFGHSLMAWAMHQHVCNRITYEHISNTIQDCFGLPVGVQRIYKFKTSLAQHYMPTYQNLIKKLMNGKVLHADETTVKLQRTGGYVWVFASAEEVIYMYKTTRKADFLHELLKDFKGVLVTDFYTGYDSLPCLQQKCLVHLIRDINEYLLKAPFDKELKSIGQQLGGLLRAIVSVIDKHGLKSRYFRKYKIDVKKYFDGLSVKPFISEIAEKLRQRMLKYQNKLFLFLDYDGVPWNNNSGEHAIKPFAKYRRIVTGQISERGLNDYLILLSIYETCQYRGIRFLDFLLSKERDLDKFSYATGHSQASHPSARTGRAHTVNKGRSLCSKA